MPPEYEHGPFFFDDEDDELTDPEFLPCFDCGSLPGYEHANDCSFNPDNYNYFDGEPLLQTHDPNC